MKRTPLKPPTVEQVRAWESKPRKRIRQRGRKAAREADAIAEFDRAVRERAGGLCEAPWGKHRWNGPTILVAHSHTSDSHPGTVAHHVWPEDRDAGRHDPDRGLYLCRAAHSWSHLNPEDAKIVGTMRPDEETA